ncbi:calcium/sodium antiporter [uncultured Desulfobacter sp.]|uniref:calcium/sodium antiporter n=1 Tax=uncultured Desulfobacter sp. TaxID=240139 RepID=UPI002AAAEDF2|nr:calcium/sodium antiporter [uncultured Desulfobacter sp.]
MSGLLLLVWSANLFIEGAAAAAVHWGMPPLLIGMVIVGFGTSLPEILVSVMSALQGSSGIALGNAYGSNIANIGLILGITALINPVTVNSRVLKNELPILSLGTAVAGYQAFDGNVSRLDAWALLACFLALIVWSIQNGLREETDSLAKEVKTQMTPGSMSIGSAVFKIVVGLVLLLASSRLLVWAAVNISRLLGVSDLIIGLTVVAVGTSLPELASSVIAARKGAHDIAVGNVLGSNLFNTLAVVGVAGVIHPLSVPPEILYRDLLVMGLFTVSLFILCYGFKGRQGRINRWEGLMLLLSYIVYTLYLVRSS